jgi:hypothetical protein
MLKSREFFGLCDGLVMLADQCFGKAIESV